MWIDDWVCKVFWPSKFVVGDFNFNWQSENKPLKDRFINGSLKIVITHRAQFVYVKLSFIAFPFICGYLIGILKSHLSSFLSNRTTFCLAFVNTTIQQSFFVSFVQNVHFDFILKQDSCLNTRCFIIMILLKSLFVILLLFSSQ